MGKIAEVRQGVPMPPAQFYNCAFQECDFQQFYILVIQTAMHYLLGAMSLVQGHLNLGGEGNDPFCVIGNVTRKLKDAVTRYASNCICGWGSTSGPAGGTYNAPQTF